MDLNELIKLNIFSNNKKILINDLFNFDNNKFYQINVFNSFDIKDETKYKLTSNHFYNGEENIPENALAISLNRGKYILISDNINFIKISKTNSTKYNNFIEFKISSNDNLYVWQTENDKIEFSIIKVNQNKKNELINTIYFKNTSESFIYTKVKYFTVSINEIIQTNLNQINEKYPHGSYNIIFHEKISNFSNENDMNNIKKNDLNKFDIENNNLVSLKNINIPNDVNPINYYCLIGKIDVLLYIDFNNDNFYLIPNGYAEAYVNLFVPNRLVETLEQTNEYTVIHITDFQLLSTTFMNHESNIQTIKKWLKCIDEVIHHKNELYYYIDVVNLENIFYERFKDIIYSNYIFIELYDIQAKAIDDVSKKIESKDILLDYEIIKCKWRYLNKTYNKWNYVDWIYNTEWFNINENKPNLIYNIANGIGVVRISKQHFMNLTNSIDINENIEGELSNTQFNELGLNKPEMNAFERFQYWTQFRLPFTKNNE